MQELYLTDFEEEILLNGTPDERREVAAHLHRLAEQAANDIREPVEIRVLNRPFIKKYPTGGQP